MWSKHGAVLEDGYQFIYPLQASMDWFQGKKKTGNSPYFIGKSWVSGESRCSLICQTIESLDSYGPLSCPPIEVTTAWHSCDLVQAASPHTLLWLE